MNKTKNIRNIITVAALGILSASCGNDWNPDELLKKDGRVSLATMPVTVETAVDGDGDGGVIDVAGYQVSIVDKADNEPVGSWAYSSMPEIVTLPEGRYKVTAENAKLLPAAWDAPYYFAAKEFSVKADEITSIDGLTCKLANVAVSIKYSEALLKALGDDCGVTVSTVQGVSLTYTKGETRVGYFELPSGASTLVAAFDGTVNGHHVSLTKSFSGITAGEHHYITFSLNSGSITPGLIIDADLTFDDIDIDIPGGEDPTPGDRPGEDNQPSITSQTLNLSGVNTITDDLIAKVDISAPNGINKLEVTIISESLTPEELVGVGLTDHFDLAHPGEYAEALSGLGFQVGDQVVGQTEMTFDITSFMSLLMFFPGNHTFQLDVTDSKGLTASASLKFYTLVQ